MCYPTQCQLVEQRLGVPAVSKPSVNPAVDRREQVACLVAPTLIPPQTGEAHAARSSRDLAP
jgi:hypothetical protein